MTAHEEVHRREGGMVRVQHSIADYTNARFDEGIPIESCSGCID